MSKKKHQFSDVKRITKIPSTIVFLFLGAVLFIDFLPYSNAIDPLYPQYLYLSLLNFVMGIYFYLNPVFLSIDTYPLLKKSYLLRSYLVFIFFSGISFFSANNGTLILEKIIELVVAFCLIINFIFLLKNRLDLLYQIIFMVCIAAFFQSSFELINLIQLASKTSISAALPLMIKTTGNINILASSLTIKIPFLLMAVINFSYFKKWFSYLVLLLVTTTIFLTSSRAAFISNFLIYIFFILFHFKTHSFNRSSLITVFKFILPVIISIFIVNFIFEKSKDQYRYVSLLKRVNQINNEDASVNIRFHFWDNSIELIKANPITGVGLGNYKVESIPYEKKILDDSSISLHSHNDFLEITAETGIINGLIYISIFIFIVFVNLKKILQSEYFINQINAMIVLMMTVVYGVDSFFNFPMFRPSMLIFFCFIVVFTIINTKASDLKFETSKSKLYPFLIVVSLITIYFTFLGYKASNLESLIKKDVANSFATPHFTGDELINKLPKYKNTLSTAESFYEYAGIYYINEKKYDKALTSFSKADKINPYFGRILFYKMIICNAKGNKDSAYTYAKKGFYLRPRNLNFYKMSTQFARLKNDTSEIFREHKLFIKYRNISEAWVIAAEELQKCNYNNLKLQKFIDKGLKFHSKDSLLLKVKNDVLVSNYIKEGQFFFKINNNRKSLECFKKALKSDPYNADTMQHLAFYFYNLENYQQAKFYFLNALKQREFNSGRTEFFIGNCYLNMNEIENACRYYAISKAKNFPDAQQKMNENCKLMGM